jgi:hypothetical protein
MESSRGRVRQEGEIHGYNPYRPLLVGLPACRVGAGADTAQRHFHLTSRVPYRRVRTVSQSAVMRRRVAGQTSHTSQDVWGAQRSLAARAMGVVSSLCAGLTPASRGSGDAAPQIQAATREGSKSCEVPVVGQGHVDRVGVFFG